jgi:hypothetical protein
MSKKILIVLFISVYSVVLSFGVDFIGRIKYAKNGTLFLTNSRSYSDGLKGCRVDYKLADREGIALTEFIKKDSCPDKIEAIEITQAELDERSKNYQSRIVQREDLFGLINPHLLSK